MSFRIRNPVQIAADALAVAEWIKATNGRFASEVSVNFGTNRDYTYQLLNEAEKHGITKIRVSNGTTLWVTLDERDARQAEADRRRSAANKARKAQAKVFAAEAAQAADAQAAEDLPVRQYWVSASEAPPIRVARPMSIFEVAA